MSLKRPRCFIAVYPPVTPLWWCQALDLCESPFQVLDPCLQVPKLFLAADVQSVEALADRLADSRLDLLPLVLAALNEVLGEPLCFAPGDLPSSTQLLVASSTFSLVTTARPSVASRLFLIISSMVEPPLQVEKPPARRGRLIKGPFKHTSPEASKDRERIDDCY